MLYIYKPDEQYHFAVKSVGARTLRMHSALSLCFFLLLKLKSELNALIESILI